MLSNSLGTNLHMWDEQVAPFTRHFRLVRYDRRGHGQSDVPKGPYSMERLGRDVLAILDGLGIERINWCGLSMGGMVGQWLGAHTRRTASTNSSSPTPPAIFPTGPCGTAASSSCAKKGSRQSLMPTWSAGSPRSFASARRRRWRAFARCSWPPISKAMSPAARRSATWTTARCSPRSQAPTLVIAGRHDPATTLEAGEFIAEHIPGAKLAVLDTAHIANMEQPQVYADTVLGFLLN